MGELHFGVYAAPNYLERAGTPARPREREDTQHRIVRFHWARFGKVFPHVMHSAGESVRVMGRYVLAVDDGNAYLAAGVAGLGIIWLPQYMASEHLERGELVTLFEEWQLDTMPLYLAFPPNRHVSTKLRVFIEWVVELMKRHGLGSDASY